MTMMQIPQTESMRQSNPAPVRRCACGGIVGPEGECSSCRAKRLASRAKPEGQPLPQPDRAQMERRFGQDFSKVRIHTDREAGHIAQSMNAAAFAIGQNITFGPGRFAPGTPAGTHLLAHELAHTIQQQNAPAPSILGMSSPRSETEAQSAAHSVSRGGRSTALSPASSLAIAKQDPKDAGTPGGTAAPVPAPPSDEPVDTLAARQTKCLIDRGNCTKVAGGGLPTEGVMAMENVTCKRDTSYTGPNLWPSEKECNSPQLFAFDSIRIARSLSTKYKGWLGVLPNCPCTDAAAKASSDWSGPGGCDPTYHKGAVTGYRSTKGYASVPGTNHGQQCCYDAKGLLITDGPGAGTPDTVQVPSGYLEGAWGTLPFTSTPGLFAVREHYANDVVPFNELGWEIYNRYWVPNKGVDCPPNKKP